MSGVFLGGLVLAIILSFVGQELDDNVASLIGFSDREFAVVGQIVVDRCKQVRIIIDATKRVEHESGKLEPFARSVCRVVPAAPHNSILTPNEDNIIATVLTLIDF